MKKEKLFSVKLTSDEVLTIKDMLKEAYANSGEQMSEIDAYAKYGSAWHKLLQVVIDNNL